MFFKKIQDHNGIFYQTHDVKDAFDPKGYRVFLLENKMLVILISYPGAEKSAVFLQNRIGSRADPEDLQGLAHLLEHMIFSGNKKYPDEYGLTDFLLKNKGVSYGLTYPDRTSHFLKMDSNKLEESLHRFANLFIKPRFDPVKLEDEIQTIHEEHLNEIYNSDQSLLFIDQETCDQSHEFHKYSKGTMETLNYNPKSQGIDVRERLINFFSENYSSHLMTLFVFGKEELDRLHEMVHKASFDKIEMRPVYLKFSSGNPFNRELMKEIKIVPNDDREQLIMDFKMPMSFFANSIYGTFYHYLNRLMVFFDDDTLPYVLQSKGWIDRMIVEETKIVFDLTKEGFNKIDEIVSVVFQYINLIKKKGPQQWVFDEVNKFLELNSDSRESKKFHNIDPKASFGKFKRKVNLDSVREYLDNLKKKEFQISDIEGIATYLSPGDLNYFLNHLNTSNLRIYIKSKNFEGKTDRKEKYYSTEYTIDDISAYRIKKWDNVGFNSNLKLPGPSKVSETSTFLPNIADELFEKKNKFWKVVENDKNIDKFDHPNLIEQNGFANLWFLKKNVFGTFKSFYGISIKNPTLKQDLVSYACMSLYVSFMLESMKRFLNHASSGGYRIEMSFNNNGIFIQIIGYRKEFEFILKKIIDKMIQPFSKLNKSDFDRAKRQFLASFKDFGSVKLESLIRAKLDSFFQIEPTDYRKKIYDYVNQLTLENVERIRRDYFFGIKSQIFAFGKVEEKDLKLIEKKFIHPLTNNKKSPISKSSLPTSRIPKLESNSFSILQESSSRHEMNCVYNYYEFGIVYSFDDIAKIKLLFASIQFEYYHLFANKTDIKLVLRTGNTLSLEIFIQHSFEVDYLDDCIEEFLISSQDHLNKLSDEDFEKSKERLKTESNHWGQSMSPEQKFRRLWKYINSEDENWNFDIGASTKGFWTALDRTTKQDIINLFNENLFKNKRKLSVRIIGEKEKSIKGPELSDLERSRVKEKLREHGVLQNGNQITDVDQFRERFGFYPSTKSFYVYGDIVGLY